MKCQNGKKWAINFSNYYLYSSNVVPRTTLRQTFLKNYKLDKEHAHVNTISDGHSC